MYACDVCVCANVLCVGLSVSRQLSRCRLLYNPAAARYSKAAVGPMRVYIANTHARAAPKSSC